MKNNSTADFIPFRPFFTSVTLVVWSASMELFVLLFIIRFGKNDKCIGHPGRSISYLAADTERCQVAFMRLVKPHTSYCCIEELRETYCIECYTGTLIG